MALEKIAVSARLKLLSVKVSNNKEGHGNYLIFYMYFNYETLKTT